jgi:hypothetical protein
MAVAAALMFLATPPAGSFLESITSRTLWVGLNQRLLPENNKWFSGMAWLLGAQPGPKMDTIPAGASPMATGSLKSTPAAAKPSRASAP